MSGGAECPTTAAVEGQLREVAGQVAARAQETTEEVQKKADELKIKAKSQAKVRPYPPTPTPLTSSHPLTSPPHSLITSQHSLPPILSSLSVPPFSPVSALVLGVRSPALRLPAHGLTVASSFAGILGWCCSSSSPPSCWA